MSVTADVAVIMGSQSDWETMRHAADTLEALGISFDARIVSAHRTPDRLVAFAKGAKAEGFKVVIAGAGGAAHLPGMAAAMTPLPVFGVPVQSRRFRVRIRFSPSCRCQPAFPSARSPSDVQVRSMPPFSPQPFWRFMTKRLPPASTSGAPPRRKAWQSALRTRPDMKNSVLKPGATIGIIGGGQLGRMLAMAAARLGFETVILEPQADCPAAQVANRQIIAAYDDPKALEELAAASDVITYEFENVPVSAADRLAEKALVFPPPAALEVSQDRFTEKQFLNSSDIETAPWRLVDDEETLIAALGALGERGILKTRRLGYDGKGQVRLTSLDETEAHKALLAINRAPAILEGFVDFEREVSVIAARDRNGNIAIFDIAENVHRNGILATSTVPAAISDSTAEEARKAVTKLLNALDYVGVLGLEFFVLKDGTLLANEFAPRVHNSGHWTEAACAISQFEQHIRAVAGLPLGNTDRHSDCVMENLIGDDVEKVPAILSEKDAVLHLYGKRKHVRAAKWAM